MTTFTQTAEERKEQNALLKRHGYYWCKEGKDWILRKNQQVVSLEYALAIIKAGQDEEVKPRYSLANKAAAIEWAHALASRPQHGRPVVVLDTETSGVDMTDVAVQIGIVNLRGDILMDTLVHPDGATISEKAYEKHKLSKETLENAPLFSSVWDDLRGILKNYTLVAYNSPFDLRILTQTAYKYGYEMPEMRWHCLMMQSAMYIGEVSSPSLKPETYYAPKLEKMCEHFGIINTEAHRALDDAVAAKDVLLAMGALYRD